MSGHRSRHLFINVLQRNQLKGVGETVNTRELIPTDAIATREESGSRLSNTLRVTNNIILPDL